MSDKTILGVVSAPQVPGAPELGPDVHLRHLFRTVEGQRNLALSAFAELKAQYETLSEQYTAHVQSLSIELSKSNHDKSLLTKERDELRAQLAASKATEQKASDNVITPKPKTKGKRVDKTA